MTLRGSHGWEIESVVGSVLRLGSDPVYLEQGAFRVGEVLSWVSPLLLVLGFGGVVCAWLLASRRTDAASPLVSDGLAPIAAISATLITATIISPQYLVWLLPFAAIAAVNGELLVAELVVGASALSVLELGCSTSCSDGDAFPVIIVLVRNVVLIGLFLACVYRLSSVPSPNLASSDSVDASS